MMQTIDLRGIQPTRAAFERLVPRPVVDVQVAVHVATELIDDVRSRGAAALREQAERFDGGAPESVRVPA
jgi:histidinol dehydrogenase